MLGQNKQPICFSNCMTVYLKELMHLYRLILTLSSLLPCAAHHSKFSLCTSFSFISEDRIHLIYSPRITPPCSSGFYFWLNQQRCRFLQQQFFDIFHIYCNIIKADVATCIGNPSIRFSVPLTPTQGGACSVSQGAWGTRRGTPWMACRPVPGDDRTHVQILRSVW